MSFRLFVASSSTAMNLYCGMKYCTGKVLCLNHAAPLHTERADPFADFSQWIAQWFDGVNIKSPVYKISGRNIRVLSHPEEFYKELLRLSSVASSRITLASLYLGNGEKEQELVNVIYDNMKSLQKPLNFDVLLECTRGSRGVKNSRTMLLPLVQSFRNSTNVALFHTPNLRGVLKAIVPERFNETINVAHLKVYLFDDTLIMSGANLSDDYFTNRQDRYIVFENCKELCDYYQDLVKTISKFSFSLQPDDTLELNPDFSFHPYKGSKRKFNDAANKLLHGFTKKHNCKTLQECFSELATDESEKDTLIMPLLQMRTMGIDQDERVTRNILASAPDNSNLLLATAYFNLTDEYWKAILNSKARVGIIMAHPKAMGFYRAPGLAGGIPNAYSLLAKRRFLDLSNGNEVERVKFLEFHRDGWTFHGKGLWASLESNEGAIGHDSACSSRPNHPFLTLIGSPNFGKRSVFRDMESQVAIVTINKELIRDLVSERERMMEDTTAVTMATYKEEDRKIVWWVYCIATFMNELF